MAARKAMGPKPGAALSVYVEDVASVAVEPGASAILIGDRAARRLAEAAGVNLAVSALTKIVQQHQVGVAPLKA
jgi:hypothetical protein